MQIERRDSAGEQAAEKLVKRGNFATADAAGAKVAAEKLIEWSKSPEKLYLRG